MWDSTTLSTVLVNDAFITKGYPLHGHSTSYLSILLLEDLWDVFSLELLWRHLLWRVFNSFLGISVYKWLYVYKPRSLIAHSYKNCQPNSCSLTVDKQPWASIGISFLVRCLFIIGSMDFNHAYYRSTISHYIMKLIGGTILKKILLKN